MMGRGGGSGVVGLEKERGKEEGSGVNGGGGSCVVVEVESGGGRGVIDWGSSEGVVFSGLFMLIIVGLLEGFVSFSSLCPWRRG